MIASRLGLTIFLCLALLAPAFAQAPATTKIINVASYSFTPKPIELVAGQPVSLTFVNQSGASHDFTAKAFFGASTITAGAAPGGKIALGPHQTKSIKLVPRAGTYQVHCSHFLHASMGMTDEIVVG